MTDRHWVAFLRAINVAGRRITNDALCAAVAACGCDDVRAYQASGNVVLRDPRPRDELAAALAEGLAEQLTYPVPVFLRAADEVRAVAAAEPFTDQQLAASAGRRQVFFVTNPLGDADHDELEALVPDDEHVVPIGAELHWLPRAGVSDSTLDVRRLEALVGGATLRTHAAVQRLAAKFL